MTDIETAIMIKNMARETVRRMTAKNALPTGTLIGKDPTKGKKVMYEDDGYTAIIDLGNGHGEKWRRERIDTLSDRYQWARVSHW